MSASVDRGQGQGTRHVSDPMAWALVAGAVAGISVAAPLAAATAAPALAVAFWRNALGTLATTPWVIRAPGPAAGRVPSGIRWRCAVAGLLLAVHFGCWMTSLRLTSIAAATALVCSTPVFTVVIDKIRGGPVGLPVLAGVALALTGVLAITGVDAASSRALTGDALALVAAVAMAGYVAVGEQVRRSLPTARYTAAVYGVCAVVLLTSCLVGGVALTGYDTRTWVELLLLTALAQLLGHSAMNAALPVVGATPLALAILLEVPGAILVAWVWLGQAPPVAAIPGTVLMLAGLVVVVRNRRAAVAEVTTSGADPADLAG